ncbi:putative lipoprotein ChiQ precursor [Serratia grimesii]|jgi:hypothetical protein|nr:Uncharacterised protein [Serratia grimesii]CAI1500672.1 Uncharacterised protein [Serratia grimesii]CAI2786411.1 Uncharacterised protein [Serratia grimesii]CUW05983.1 putative lipoprotein ChiQ precursor [Serratia grimesii]SMZ55546.1 putative lipoprotein ChiQ precursor [Serratia grimesii]
MRSPAATPGTVFSPLNGKILMKKIMLMLAATVTLSACVQPAAPPEDVKLKQAYSACINTAEGSPERLQPCKAVLNVLKQEKQHQQFAEQETVRVMDYQNCIQAVHSGNGQAYDAKCGKIWKEIHDNNN